MKKHFLVVVATLLAGMFAAQAHNLEALKLNEIMVENNSSVVDEYGNHSAWIELFNSNFGPLNISSVYLTNDSTNPQKYPVPIGDEITVMGKRQHIVFFADGKHSLGTLHTNFTLVPGQDNWIGVYDAGGKLIDSVTVKAALKPDQSFARVDDGAEGWEIRTPGDAEKYITPGSANKIKGTNPRIENFAVNDPNGFTMTAMAMCIVFGALLVLCLCFYVIGMIGKSAQRVRKAEAHGVDVAEVARDSHDSGEEIAAISLALHEHFNQHDNESFMLTVRKMKRAYSPWSSKIYGLRETPEHRRR